MTEIMVSKRDGIAKGPDGTKYRVARGKTLADARHPLVQAHPNDWTPMRVELSVEGGESGTATAVDEAALEELRNDLAEAEELAEARGAELLDLVKKLNGVATLVAQHGELPPEDDRGPGWLVAAVRRSLQAAYGRGRNDAAPAAEPAPVAAESEQQSAAPDVPAPRPPRAAKRAGRAASDD